MNFLKNLTISYNNMSLIQVDISKQVKKAGIDLLDF